jgi:hypothetical protein
VPPAHHLRCRRPPSRSRAKRRLRPPRRRSLPRSPHRARAESRADSDPDARAGPGASASGVLDGSLVRPAVTGVAAIVALGPDNVLKEGRPGRTRGRRFVPVRRTGPRGYRLVASGASGRVVLCDPPYLSVRLDGSQAVAAPAWRAIRVP